MAIKSKVKPTKKKTTKKKPVKTRSKVGSQPRAVKKSEITEDTPLLEMEQRFADEYLKDLNQTQSAIRAGYSVKNAASIASRMRKQVNVSAYIARKCAEQSIRTGTEVDRILREAARIAFVNITDLADADASLREDANRDDTAAVSSIKYKRSTFGEDQETEEREIKLSDKNKAIEVLLKYGRVSAEFEAKMKIEKEKLALQREQLEIDKARLALDQAKAAQKDDINTREITIKLEGLVEDWAR